MIQERANNVAVMYNEVYSTPDEYLIHLPALHQCISDCRVYHYQRDSNWSVSNFGIYNAFNEASLAKQNDRDFIVKLRQKCKFCKKPCISVIKFTKRCKRNRYGIFANAYYFVDFIIDSDVNSYQIEKPDDISQLMWYLNLFGYYARKEYLLLPWMNTNQRYMESVYKFVKNGGLGRVPSERTMNIMRDPDNPRWKALRFLYGQLIDQLKDKAFLLNQDQQELYEDALTAWENAKEQLAN